uniref:Ribosome silencing factor n=1 Tax=Pseudo-nitzschia australis TaxID=44445 RepID=A0A7S4AWD4_9STRA|mmetsp:Transcript_19814/g.42989  ORF Transcript_19814/g.42989 Transcript_19814/m.42989 type:complete len:255 (-) Transcript_19814:225-989(-)
MISVAFLSTALLAISSLYTSDAWSHSHSHSHNHAARTTIKSNSNPNPRSLPTLNMGGRTNQQRREDRNRYQKNNDMLDFIDKEMSSEELVGDLDTITDSPENDELAPLVNCIIKAADGRKADNIVAIRVSKVSTICSFVVICTGNSRPQNQAIASIILDDVRDQFDLLPGATGVPEGSADSGWTVLDFGSVMVHVMTPRSRLFYNVEGKWKDQGGEYMDISSAILPTGAVPAEDESSKSGTMEGLSEEEDPFWS